MTLTLTHVLVVLVLLAAANGAPVLATRLLGRRWARPIDGGRCAWDGRPWLGTSKTWRGVAVAVAGTGLAAAAMGLPFSLGVGFGAASMAGDVFSSFTKRRLGIVSSGQAIGLDQIPEALFPLLVCRHALALSLVDVVLLVAVFTVAQIVVSPIMYFFGIRSRPY